MARSFLSLYRLLSTLLTAFIFLTASVAQGMVPLRDPQKLWEAKVESVKRVQTSRIMLADYDLIRKDFPEIRNRTNAELDHWLLENTSFISTNQARQNIVNEPIQTKEEFVQAYRPREYRRAHVFAASTGGLIDAKGTGAVDPSGGSHDNGLATLGDMIREYMYEKLIHAIFIKDRRFDTVGSYAVIDYGFSIIHPDGGKSRAGIILRQAHTRYHDGPSAGRTRNQSTMLPRQHQLEIETFLREFGITSSVKFMGKDLVNLQGADNGAVIDFGSFLVEQKFKNDVSFFYNRKGGPHTTAEDIIMKSTDAHFPQPNPKMQIPFQIWGYSHSGKADSKYDNPFIWSHELAESIAEGRATRADAEQHVRNFFDQESVQKIFRSIAPACSRVLR